MSSVNTHLEALSLSLSLSISFLILSILLPGFLLYRRCSYILRSVSREDNAMEGLLRDVISSDEVRVVCSFSDI